MSAAERRYLQVLAHGRDGAGSADTIIAAPPERIDPGVVDLVQRLDPFPTFVKGRRWDVLTANPPRGSCSPIGRRFPLVSAIWCGGCS